MHEASLNEYWEDMVKTSDKADGRFPVEPEGTDRLLAPSFVAGSPHIFQIFGRTGFVAEAKIRPVAARITSQTRSRIRDVSYLFENRIGSSLLLYAVYCLLIYFFKGE
jgi:hypothetical protein